MLVVVVVLVVVGLLVFGLPRLRRRRRVAEPLFDDQDRRDLRALRRAAAAAAEAGDWPLAIEERYRAIVRGIVDRDLVRVHPGTTARGVADAAAARSRRTPRPCDPPPRTSTRCGTSADRAPARTTTR